MSATDRRYEITLTCGDTVSSEVRPTPGARRKCIHCESMKSVTKVIDTYLHVTDLTPAPVTPTHLARDTAYGYASAYGYAAQQLEFIRQACDDRLPNVDSFYGLDEESTLRSIRDMADRGIREASDALKRYDARIETIENGAQHSLRRVQSDS